MKHNPNKTKFIIFDWAGNDLSNHHGTFETFDDAWYYILGDMTDNLNLTETDYQEYDVREIAND